MEYLDISDPLERAVADRVLQKAIEIDEERRAADVKAMMVAVQNGIARAFK